MMGAKQAKLKGNNPNYYDGLVDGVVEAIGALRQEIGLYWGALRKEIDSDGQDQK